jgi:hypothetical protein
MTKEQEEKIGRLLNQTDDLHTKVCDLHAFVFGVQGEGGLSGRVKALEGSDMDNKMFKAKVLGVAGAAGLAASLLGSKIGAAITSLFGNK